MWTKYLTIGVVVLAAACSREPAQQPPAEPAPTAVVCNDVTPNPVLQVAVQEAPPSAAAAAELRGGRIAPGLYDLASAVRVGAATGWTGTRAVTLRVSETEDGTLAFDWASAAADGAVDSWTALLRETPAPARIEYTCGRVGQVEAAFAVEAGVLNLRIQDGAGGQLALSFNPRG